MRHAGYEIGDILKAYHFKPMEGLPDQFLIGKVTEINPDDAPQNCQCYKIDIYHNTLNDSSTEGWIPMEVAFFEFDSRVSKTTLDEVRELKIADGTIQTWKDVA